MLTKDKLAVDIRTKAEQIAREVNQPRGEWDSFILELAVGELATMVKVYRDLPLNRQR